MALVLKHGAKAEAVLQSIFLDPPFVDVSTNTILYRYPIPSEILKAYEEAEAAELVRSSLEETEWYKS